MSKLPKSPKILKVESYEAKITNGSITIYANTSEGPIPIPDDYKDLCNDNHLALRLTTLERPELFGLPETDTSRWLPVRTAPLDVTQ